MNPHSFVRNPVIGGELLLTSTQPHSTIANVLDNATQEEAAHNQAN